MHPYFTMTEEYQHCSKLNNESYLKLIIIGLKKTNFWWFPISMDFQNFDGSNGGKKTKCQWFFTKVFIVTVAHNVCTTATTKMLLETPIYLQPLCLTLKSWENVVFNSKTKGNKSLVFEVTKAKHLRSPCIVYYRNHNSEVRLHMSYVDILLFFYLSKYQV